MASKQEFLESIVPGIVIDEVFYKKVYSYYMDDKEILPIVAKKLSETGNGEAVRGYNEWLRNYKDEKEAMLKEVSRWYRGEVDRQYREAVGKTKEHENGEEVKGWQDERTQLLEKKKELLHRLKALTES